MKTTRISMLLAAASLAAVPVAAEAARGGHEGGHRGGKRTVNKSYVVTGKLKQDGFSADDPVTTSVNEAVVEITVKNANRHARRSGELEDQNTSRKGVQVKGGNYALDNDDDLFKVVLSGYEQGEQPAANDKVRIAGKIPYARDKSLSLADRYGVPNIRRIKLVDSD